MADPLARLRRFLRELKRRNVYKVAVAYLAVAFVGLQAARLLVPATTLPGWADELLIYVAAFGFPIALVVAWAFELTPEGVRRTPGADVEPAAGSAVWWVGLAVVVLLAGGVWYATTGDGGEPAENTSATADTVQATETSTDRSRSRDRPFVAVLPLENLSPSEENAFFADGIHEEILAQLASVSGLGVYARTTMQQYGRSDQTVSEIGRELGAEAVLEGSVRRAADRVRITVQLIDPESRDHLWSETYERTLSPDAVFDIQAEVAERVAGSLETRLTSPERTRIARAPTQDMEAYDAYLKGRSHLLDGWEEAGGSSDWYKMGLHVDSAVIDLRKAVASDTAFAEAHGLLGYAYALRSSFMRDDRWRDSARRSAGRAERLGTEVASVPLTRGFLYQLADSAKRAEDALRRALASDPQGSFAVGHLSYLLMREGDHRGNLAWLLRAVRRDPRNMALIAQTANQLATIGFTDAALAWCRYGLKHDPEDAWLLVRRALLMRDAGRHREALALIRDMPDPRPGMEAYFHLYLDEPGRAVELLDRAQEQREERAGTSETLSAGDLPTWLTVNRGYAHVRGGDEALGRKLLRRTADSLRAELEKDPDPIKMTQLAQANHVLGGTAAARDDLRVATRELGLTRLWPLRSAIFDDVRHERWFRERQAEVETNRADVRQEVRRMGLDLYPPGAERDSVTAQGQTDG